MMKYFDLNVIVEIEPKLAKKTWLNGHSYIVAALFYLIAPAIKIATLIITDISISTSMAIEWNPLLDNDYRWLISITLLVVIAVAGRLVQNRSRVAFTILTIIVLAIFTFNLIWDSVVLSIVLDGVDATFIVF